ncbi:4Fe-4S binding protein [Paraclostridium bifermentans]|nr:4Fe-4S binding protein [Paraclostridium bifermentans]
MELNENLKNKVKDDENKCINCKLCFHKCPMMKEFENSPKDFNE